VETPDLQALAAALPDHGVSVALVTQPYRMSRTRAGSDEASLDAVWRAIWPIIVGLSVPVISGRRSAGQGRALHSSRSLESLRDPGPDMEASPVP
jgi:uncharacterized protein